MDNEGRQVVVNQDAGVYWGGLWLSNTYAWSATGSAGKHQVNAKKAKKQSKEMPEARSYKNYYQDEYTYGIYKKPDDIEGMIESNLDDLEYMGFTHGVTMGMALDFVDEFGVNGFLDVVDQAIDGQIPMDWFNKVIEDHKVARECFPYLGKYESIE
jgi:hypothetical protein